MRFTVKTADFARALRRIQGVLKGKKNDPMQECVGIEARANRLSLSAQTSQMSMVVWLPATFADTENPVMVHGQTICAAVQGLPDDPENTVVHTDTEKRGLTIESARIKYFLHCMKIEGDREAHRIEGIEMRQVGTKLLLGMLEKTLYATSVDTTRENLGGIHFENHEEQAGVARLTSTDGHRLTYCEGPVGLGAEWKPFTLPDHAAEELKRLLADDKRTDVGFDKHRMVVKTADDVVLSMRLIDSQYPDYRQVVPKNHTRKALIEREPMIKSLRRLALMQEKSHHQGSFKFSDGTLIMESSAGERGSAAEEIPIEYTGEAAGESFKIGFNASYVLEALQRFDIEKVEMLMTTEIDPCMFAAPDDRKQIAVIMPCRLGS